MREPDAAFFGELFVINPSVGKESKTLEHGAVAELLCVTNE
jgi:hypothetical protein